MNLARHSITSTDPVHIFDARFDPTCQVFTASTPAGFAVYRTWPLELIRKRELTGGTLAAAVPLDTSNILFLLGGGRSPRYSPNKVIVWDDALAKEVAALEFKADVKGIACRRGWLAVALRRRVVVFTIEDEIRHYREWETFDNPRGLIAMATAASSTLLAIVGMQMGHVQLIHLPECVAPASRGPPFPDTPPSKRSSHLAHTALMIAAHKSALATLSIPPSGSLLATTSSQGTLVRVWDTSDGNILGEFRRGLDKAEIYGVAFRPDEREICVWSDKGTIHAFTLGWSGATNRQSKMFSLTPYLPLPDYFTSAWSYAKYRIPVQSAHISLSSTSVRGPKADGPEEERCVVGWIKVPTEGADSRGPVEEYQMIALTYAGGWYRLSLPKSSTQVPSTPPTNLNQLPHSPTKLSSGARPGTPSGSSTVNRSEKGKEKEEKPAKEGQNCTLQEFRRFGRWDGWG